MQSDICSLLVHHQEENMINVILPGKITSFHSPTTTPKDVSTRSRLKTTIESSLAHLDLIGFRKRFGKTLRVVGSTIGFNKVQN
jgi:hypothetical protein